MEPLNRAIALIGIPWYNVIGNHDINFEAQDDEHSDETFERIYGPSYYSFDHGPVHFLVLDDVRWFVPEGQDRGRYVGGLGKTQMEFIRNDLALIPEDQLVVLMMHIPLVDVEDRDELYDLIEKRPFSMSISAHTHYQQHVFIGKEDGFDGAAAAPPRHQRDRLRQLVAGCPRRARHPPCHDARRRPERLFDHQLRRPRSTDIEYRASGPAEDVPDEHLRPRGGLGHGGRIDRGAGQRVRRLGTVEGRDAAGRPGGVGRDAARRCRRPSLRRHQGT